ncbi:hypothetical protein PQ610_00820 [Tardisphaera miroshnichenkoae]
MANEPEIVRILGDAVSDWQFEQDAVIFHVNGSKMDYFVFKIKHVELSLGDSNWTVTGVKGGFARDVTVKMTWKGMIFRKPVFVGSCSEALNGDSELIELCKLISPVDLAAEAGHSTGNSLLISGTISYSPSPFIKSNSLALLKILDRVYDHLLTC